MITAGEVMSSAYSLNHLCNQQRQIFFHFLFSSTGERLAHFLIVNLCSIPLNVFDDVISTTFIIQKFYTCMIYYVTAFFQTFSIILALHPKNIIFCLFLARCCCFLRTNKRMINAKRAQQFRKELMIQLSTILCNHFVLDIFFSSRNHMKKISAEMQSEAELRLCPYDRA